MYNSNTKVFNSKGVDRDMLNVRLYYIYIILVLLCNRDEACYRPLGILGIRWEKKFSKRKGNGKNSELKMMASAYIYLYVVLFL